MLLTKLINNPNVPKDVEMEIATNPKYESDLCIDLGLRTSNGDALAALSKHTNPFVRAAVAYNRNTPRASLSILATDPEIKVRKGVAANTYTHPDDLTNLANQTIPLTSLNEAFSRLGSGNLSERLDEISDLVSELKAKIGDNDVIQYRVAINPSAPYDVVVNIAKNSHNERVRSCARKMLEEWEEWHEAL